MPTKKAVKTRRWVTCAEPGCKRRAGTSKPYCGVHQKQFDKKTKAAAARRKRAADGKVVEKKTRRERKEDARKETKKKRAVKKAIAKLSRLIKAHCEKCEYTIRLSRKWIEVKRPICPVCMRNMATAIDGEPDADPRQLKLKGPTKAAMRDARAGRTAKSKNPKELMDDLKGGV